MFYSRIWFETKMKVLGILCVIICVTEYCHCKPNVVIFVADDLGYGDVACFGNTTLKTPNIDRIALEGAKMTHHLSAASMCSPSRTALLTGRYPIRSGMVPSGMIRINIFVASSGGLPSNETTLAELAKSQGYHTALIGKWHLGSDKVWYNDHEHHPLSHGFDYFYGLPLTNLKDFGNDGDRIFRQYLPKWFMRCSMTILMGSFLSIMLYRKQYIGFFFFLMFLSLSIIPPSVFYFAVTNMKLLNSILMKNYEIIEQPIRLKGMTQRLVHESIEFLEQRRKDKDPFLLVVSWTHVHTAIEVTKNFRGRTRHGRYGDAVEEMDHGVGQILNALDNFNFFNNTIVYFTSDNGGFKEERGINGEIDGGHNGPFKGGKGHGAVEGGIRMPGVIRWPGHIKPGTVTDEPTWMMDMYPTIANAIQATLPTDRIIDGRDLLPLLSKKESVSPHEFMVHYCGNEVHAVRYRPRTGNKVWKLVFITPNYDAGKDTCAVICDCNNVVRLKVPLLYELTSDPSESKALNYTGNKELEHLVAILTQGLQRHIHSVEQVEMQFNTRNNLWRPHLQGCCNFPYCSCRDDKYSDYE